MSVYKRIIEHIVRFTLTVVSHNYMMLTSCLSDKPRVNSSQLSFMKHNSQIDEIIIAHQTNGILTAIILIAQFFSFEYLSRIYI